MNKTKTLCAWILGALPSMTLAQTYLSPNGFSGLGLIPAATTLPAGSGWVGQDNTIPGASNTSGSNFLVGFGLMPGLEVLGRLATQDTKCNMFAEDLCPPGTIRDFSASLKWSPQHAWLKSHGIDAALGISDAGGAANYFRSYYAVASKALTSQLDLRLGAARGTGINAMLDGPMAALDLRLPWTTLSLQQVNGTRSAHAGLTIPTPVPSLSGWITLNHRLSDAPTTNGSWIGAGLSFALDGVQGLKNTPAATPTPVRAVRPSAPESLARLLVNNGFYKPQMGRTTDGTHVIELENSSYAWNIVDAAGVALGAVASALGDTPQQFELILRTRGVRQLLVKGDSACLKRWLQSQGSCAQLQVASFSQQEGTRAASTSVQWSEAPAQWWQRVRPELVVGPLLATKVGTELGAFDMDLGVNLNLFVPLWNGAILDINRQEPTSFQTRQFDQGGGFYASRIQSTITRRMLHQLVSLESINTQARISLGSSYTSWEGAQLETATQSDDGRHRAGVLVGHFDNDRLRRNNSRGYSLYNYRYAWNDAHRTTSELVAGEFWAGDKGYQLSQKFWHGETAITIYVRQSKMAGTDKVSFAGIQVSLPLTPRQNRGLEHFALRGANQWSYSLETKILDNDNRLTGGYGEVPRMGETLVQILNRDRNTSQYFQSQLPRMKEAYGSLFVD